MIAKFRTSTGWAYHDCDRILIEDKPCKLERLDSALLYLEPTELGPKEEGRLASLFLGEVLTTVAYGFVAYLCNDKGETINSI